MTDFSSIRPNALVQNAYGQSKDLKAAEVKPEQAESFGDMLRAAAQQSAESVRQGDEVATAGLIGDASVQQVVEATMDMESTVRVSVAVRDKQIPVSVSALPFRPHRYRRGGGIALVELRRVFRL